MSTELGSHHPRNNARRKRLLELWRDGGLESVVRASPARSRGSYIWSAAKITMGWGAVARRFTIGRDARRSDEAQIHFDYDEG